MHFIVTVDKILLCLGADEIEIQIMGFKMDPTILLYLKILALCIKNITFK
jgi:hypothetical protein